MKKLMKKTIVMLLVAVMILTLLPTSAFAGLTGDNGDGTGWATSDGVTLPTVVDDEYPETAFEVKADNGVIVKVSAPEGAFPAGTTIKVTALSDSEAEKIFRKGMASDQEFSSAKGVDITFYDADGNEIQPSTAISVNLEYSGLTGDNFSIVHENDNGTVEEVAGTVDSTTAAFEASSFSSYVVGGTNTMYVGPTGDYDVKTGDSVVVRIKLCYENGTVYDVRTTSIYKADGASTYDLSYSLPALEDGYSYTFAESYSDFGLNGTTLTGTFTEAGVNEVALLKTSATVNYTVKSRYSGTVDESKTYTESGKVGELTNVVPETSTEYAYDVDQQVIKADGSTVVYIDYTPLVYYLRYESNGGSYVEEKSGSYGAVVSVYEETEGSSELTCGLSEHTHTTQPSWTPSYEGYVSGCWISCKTSSGGGGYFGWGQTRATYGWKLNCTKTQHTHSSSCYTTTEGTFSPLPTRAGYTFGGWYADAACTIKADEQVTLTSDVTVYAKWTPSTANYTVAFFSENNDGTYSYQGSKVVSGTVGSTVDGSGQTTTFTNSGYYYVDHYTSDTVAADNSTVIEVYYNLSEYTLQFSLAPSSGTSPTSATLTMDGVKYTLNGTKYTIKCKLGQDVSALWPPYENVTFKFQSGSYNLTAWVHNGVAYSTKRFEVTPEMLNGTDTSSVATYYADYTSGATLVTINYWLENAEDSDYTKSERYSQQAYTTGGFTYKELDGFTYSKSVTGNNIYNFYYTRSTYSITYKYKDSTVATKTGIKFGKDISGSDYNFTPSVPTGVASDAVFEGWYDNPECYGSPYTFSTMPSSNLVLYAKWSDASKTVTLVYNNGQADDFITVAVGGTVGTLPTPVKAGYNFTGWYEDEDCTLVFDPTTKIYEDKTIYAGWAEKEFAEYTVRYVYGTEIVASKTLSGMVGKTVIAKANVEDVPVTYQTGEYVFTPESASLKVSADETENVITFNINKLADLKYVVKYVYNDVVKELDDNDGNKYTAESSNFRVYPDETIANNLYKNGYKVKEVYKVADFSEGTDIEVVFELEPVTYSIIYKGIEDGDTWADGSATNPNRTTYTTVDNPFAIVNPVRDGYTFAGWVLTDSTSVQECSPKAHDGLAAVVGTGSYGTLTFEATWTKNTVVEFVANDASYVYNGKEQTVSGFGKYIVSVTGKDPVEYALTGADQTASSFTVEIDGKTYTISGISASGKGTNVGDYENAVSGTPVVKLNGTTDKSLVVKTTDGTLTITGQAVTVKAQDASKTYGDEDPELKADVTGLIGKDTIEYTVSRVTGENAGEYAISATGDVTQGNYIVTYEGADFTINPRKVTLTSASDSKVYDGKPLTNDQVTDEGFVNDEGAAYTVTGTQTTIGSSDNTFTYKLNDGVNADNYTVKQVVGTLTVTPVTDKVTVTIKENSGEYEYDGTEKTVNGYEVVSISNELYTTSDFTFSGDASVSGTDAGTYDMEITADDFVNNNSNFKEVEFVVKDGQLKITPIAAEIVVTANSAERAYNGSALTDSGYTYQGIVLGGHTLNARVEGSQTDAGETANKVTYVQIKDANGKDVTANYTIGDSVDGTLKVTPATLTVTTGSASKVYDGTALTAAGSIKGFVNNETATFAVTGSQTKVGTSENSYSLKWDGTAKKTNYSVTENLGTLEVTEYAGEITVTTTGGTFTYDGKAHGATVEVTGLPKTGYAVEVATSDDTATHVAEGTVTADCDNLVIKNAAGEDVTSKLNIKYVDGSIAITPATLTVTTESASKVYNGEALTASGSVTGYVGSETATFTVTGSQTEVGSSDNTYTLTYDKTAVESDYSISENIGTLSVTESSKEIVVTTSTVKVPYDGSAHGAEVTVTGLPTGYTVEKAESSATATHVSEGVVTAKCDTLVIKNAAGKDVTKSLNIKYVDGSIEITPVTLTITTPNADKVYDGTALTAEGSIEGFVNNETATFETTGTQTAVGFSNNTYSLTWDGTAKEDDYSINETIGKLTVTEFKGQIKVTTTGGEFTYDGKVHGATVTVTGLPETGYTVETATSDDSATHVSDGVVTANCDTLVIKNAQGEDVTYKLNISYENGTIKINPAQMTVTTESAAKTYDGTALTAGGNVAGLVDGEHVTLNMTGSQTAVGSSSNTYTLDWDWAKPEDYNVVSELGTLTVTESTALITVNTVGGIFTYDGATHGATVTVTGVPTGYTVETATSSATATHVEDGVVTADADVLVIKNAQGEDVTSKLNIHRITGTIKINKAVLSVKTESAEKVYDGTDLTAGGKLTGLIQGEEVTFEVTGKQRSVGTSSNTYTLTFDKNAKESDYTLTDQIGTLEVVESQQEIKVKVNTDGGVFIYSGESHGAEVEVTNVPEGYWVDVAKSNANETHVTGKTITAQCDELVIRNMENEDVTSRMNISYTNGTILILPATVTVITETAFKVYDGTALTAPGTMEGLVNNETATFEVTGSRTAVGSSSNTYTLTWDGTALESDYAVSATVGTLTVTESADVISVVTTGERVTYDGSAHGAIVTVSNVPDGYTVATATSSATLTNVGTVAAKCDNLVILNAEGADVTSKLQIKYTNGTVEVLPATLVVTTPDAEKVYDGTALTAEGSVSGFINGETATFKTTGTQTTVGSSSNTYTLTWDGTADRNNYTVQATTGTLTVTEYAGEIVVKTTGGTFTYDGSKHGATVEASQLPTGYSYKEEPASSASATHVSDGTVKATADVLTIVNAAGEDVTKKLNIKYIDDVIVITPATLTVETPSRTKVYDGKALTALGSISGFVSGEKASFTTTGTQTEVGSSLNTYSLTFDKTAVASDYQISENLGTLTVNEYDDEILVTTTGGTFTYDGDAHGATVKVTGLPEEGYTVRTATSDDKVTHVSEGTVEADCDNLVIVNASGKDVTANLNIKRVNGTLAITPATLTVVTESATKVYDGEPLTASGTIKGFVKDESATFKTTGSQTAVGTSDNTYAVTWDGTAKETDYTFDASTGKLTVTQSEDEIVVTTTGGTFTYDGKAHGATVEVSALPEGYELINATSDDTATHVSEGVVTATCDTLVIHNAAGEDVTSSLNIRKVDGEIEIIPATLTITTPDAEKVYDGTALTADGTISGIVGKETVVFNTTGSQTEVGSSKNTYSLAWGTAQESDYKKVESIGTLTVTEYDGEILVTTTGGKFVYDGAEHAASVTVSTLPAGYTLVSAVSADTATHVADGIVEANCDYLEIRNAQGKDVTKLLKITYVNGTIEITPKELNVVTASAEKVYDGTALTAGGSISGFVEGESATFEVTGKQTIVGSSVNTYDLTFNKGTAVSSDYKLVEDLGNLKVIENTQVVTVETVGGIITYDGNEHVATVTVKDLPKGYNLVTAKSNDKVTHVSEGVKSADCDELVIEDVEGNDVTSQLNINYVNGTLQIVPTTLTVKTDSDSKVYDGTKLTAGGSVSGFVNGETATFKVTGSQTEVGSSKNTYEIEWTGTAQEEDYTPSETLGTLAITQTDKEIVVTTTGGSFVYDGNVHKATVEVSQLPTGYILETAKSNDSATHVADGTVVADCDELKIVNMEGEDVTAELKITYLNDEIKITPKTLNVVTESASKVYDGTAITAGGSITGFVEGEDATFEVTGSQKSVGESKNTYTVKWDGSAKASDYEISEILGILAITDSKAPITVTTVGGEFTYDGAAHGATVTVTGVPTGYTVKTATSSATATHVAEGKVVADCDTLVIVNAEDEDVTSKLNITKIAGSIQITPATLTIKTDSASKVYDGTALTAGGTITGFVEGEDATFEVTGSQEAVGSSNNTYSLKFDQNAAESDYTKNESIGSLTVTESTDEIVVTTTGGEFTYDGAVHGATVEVTGLPAGYKVIIAASSATATHVAEGKVTATCDKLIIANDENVDVTSKLKITKVDGTIEIKPATIYVTTGSAEREYDGTALTAGGSISGFIGEETATFAVTGSQTAVGTSTNTYSMTWDGTATASDYELSEKLGTLKITESTAEITVVTTGGEFTYDGQPHKASVAVLGTPAGYTVVTALSNDSMTHASKNAITADCDELKIVNAAGEDVTSRLNIKRKDGSIKVNPRELTVKTDSAQKEYDGTALTAGGKISGFVTGEKATFEVTGSQKVVGKSSNTYSLAFDQNALASDYKVVDQIGDLEVIQSQKVIEVVVDTKGGTFTYDGNAHGATVKVGELPAGYVCEKAVSNASVTHVSEGKVKAECDELVIRNLEGEDVTSELNIHVTTGTLQILPAPLSVVTDSASKVYDGTALKAGGEITGFVAGETATFKTTGSQEKVGESDNTYSLTYDGTAVESDYKVASETIGKLVVTENADEIVVTTIGGTFTYDGQPHGATSVEVSELPAGYSVQTKESYATATNVAESGTEVTCDNLVIVNADGVDVTEYLNIKKVPGTVTIIPATLTVVTESAEKVYDGTALKAGGSISGFVNGETATFEVTGSQKKVGSSDNTYSLTYDENTDANNYKLDETIGKLTVKEYAGVITVDITGETCVYDGNTHKATVTVSTLPAGYTLKKKESKASVTHVSEGEVTAVIDTLVIVNADGEDVTDRLNIVGLDGSATLQVTPAPLTIKTESDKKEYDGTALTAGGSISGFVNGETATFEVTGSQKIVGKSSNTYSLTWDGTAEESDYAVNADLGTLEVIQSQQVIEIVVDTKGGTFTYDGNAHGATVKVGALPAGYACEKAVSNASVTHVSEGKVEAKCDELVIKNLEGEDVTSELNIHVTTGTLQILPAPLSVVTDSASKVYDGTALKAGGEITGFVAGETVTFKTTGSQEKVGESDNTYSLTWNGTAAESDYDITNEEIGKLVVTENADEIVVTAIGGTFTYDGLAHGATDIVVSELPDGYEVQTKESYTTITNAGEAVVNCDKLVIVNVDGEDVTERLNIKKVPGTVTIIPATLTVVTESAEKVYDGTVLTAGGSISGFITGEGGEFKVTGSQKKVGESDNTYSLTYDENTLAGNYQLDETIGKLKVNENTAEIEVEITGGTYVYDGETYKATVEVTGIQKGYTCEKAESKASVTHVADGKVVAVVDELVIRNDDGEDVTDKLNIIGRDSSATLQVTPAPLTIKTESDKKEYDGTDLTAGGSISGFVNNENATFKVTGSQKIVGKSSNTYSLKWDKTAVSTDYNVLAELGTLEVIQSQKVIEVVVDTKGGTFTYDGNAHGATVKVGTLPTGYVCEKAVSNASVTHVSEGKVEAKCDELVIKNLEGQDVTSELNIHITTGTLQILPAPLSVVTDSASKVYDGTALKAGGEITGFVAGETATFKTTGSQEQVGESDNTYSLTYDGTAAESDYKVASETIGKLVVTESTDEIVVTTIGGTFTYDGQPHGATDIVVSELPDGYEVQTKESYTTITNAGEAVVNCDKLVIVNADGVDVTEYLNITKVPGTVTITPATLTVVTESAEKVYDGTALKAGGSISGFITGEGGEFKVTGSQKKVGSSDNTYSLTYDENTDANNYKLDETIGKLTVKEYAGVITVDITGETCVYDGNTHKATVTVSTLPAGYTLEKKESKASVTHVSEGEVTAVIDTLVIVNADGEDVTDKLNIAGLDGSATLQVTPAPLTIKTESASRTYNGKALKAGGSISGFVNDETATFEVTGSQTEVGTSDNTYSLTWDGTAKADDYTENAELGTLTVSEYAGEVRVITTGGSYVYDGDTHGATAWVEGLPEGYEVEICESTAQVTHVVDGVVTAKADKLKIVNAQGKDVTELLNLKREEGTITVTPKDITVTTDSGSKVYDGTVLTAGGRVEGLVKDETVSFKVTGSQKKAGSSDNTYTLKWNGTAKESDYNMTEKVGKLTVTEFADEIVLTVNDATYTYDGASHGTTVTVGTVPAGYYVERAASTARATHASEGKVAAYADDVVIRNADGEDVTSKLNIKRVPGSITINKATVTVVTESASRIYNGAMLTASGSITGLVNGESAGFTVTGSQTEIGTSTNTYSLTWNGSASEDDYSVVESLGTLSVTGFTGTVTVNVIGGTYTYDGEDHGATVTVTGLPNGYYVDVASSDAIVHNVSDGVVIADVDHLVIRNADGVDVTSTLNIITNPGTLEVAARTITITSNSATKKYDGTDLTSHLVTVTGDGFVGNEGTGIGYSFTGKQKEVGTSENTFTYVLPAGTDVSNYNITLIYGKLEVFGSISIIPVTPPEDEPYELIIHYVDKDGNEVTETYRGEYYPGESFRVETPVVDGYTPQYSVIESSDAGMPSRDVEIFVLMHEGEPESEPETGEVNEDGEGGFVITALDPNKVPLADFGNGEKCCAMHFLLILAAFILVWIYTSRRKKHQKRIFELKEELEQTKLQIAQGNPLEAGDTAKQAVENKEGGNM